MPKFSILIPVYGVEKYIRQCVESVINQTYKDFEAIFVDDCSPDNSIHIVEEYAKNDDRIKILYHKVNKRQGGARNTALDNATGKYILCVDSDDWLEPDCLKVLSETFEKVKNVTSIWYNGYTYIEPKKAFLKETLFNIGKSQYLHIDETNLAQYTDYSWVKCYTRESLLKYNIRWPENITFEDGEFYYKYYSLYNTAYVLTNCLVNYRMREGSTVQTASTGNIRLNDLFTVVYNLRDFWIEQGLYNKYKFALLNIIYNRLHIAWDINYSKENKELTYQFLKNMNFPDEFKELIDVKDSKPLVSVVVPVYNVEQYISECLDSIINQTYSNLEIICVDDCGQDNSMNIVEEYARKDSRIKIIHHDRNRGLGGARNTGLENATGEYIFFVDSDDWIETNCVDIVTNKLIETKLDTVFFKADVFWQNAKKRTPIWYQRYAMFPQGMFNIDVDRICDLPHYSWNKGYRRQFLIDNNIRWSENIIYEDIEFFFKVYTKSPLTYMISAPLYIYRRREDSIIGQCYGQLIHAEDLYIITKNVKDYLTENNLMDKYYKSFLNLVLNNLNNYNGYGEIHTKQVPLMLKCLQDIDFPESFKEYVEKE